MVGRLSEDTPPRPTTPYAVSKLAAEHAVLEWGVRTGNEAIVARPFNHSGPGQKPHYFLASMAKQMASLPPEGGTIEVGNLGVRRDFMHVEDVIGAYRLLLSRGKPQEIYHIATGRSRPLSDYLELLRRHCPHPVEWVVSPERYRDETTQPVEISTERLRLHTGWSPQRTTDELCRDLIEYWTEKQKKGD